MRGQGESAQLVVRNALCGESRRWSELAVPWCTYTHPEVAHVGAYGAELEAQGWAEGNADAPQQFATYTMPFGGYDRPKCDGDRVRARISTTIISQTVWRSDGT